MIYFKKLALNSFRARDPHTGDTTIVGFTQLDEKYNPTGKVHLLKLGYLEMVGRLIQDPRLIVIKKKLYIIYSNTWKFQEKITRRVFVAEIKLRKNQYVAKNTDILIHFDGIKNNKVEKNWVPFEYNGRLLLSYTINPHKVFLPILGKSTCKTIVVTEIDTEWEWGTLRGGTPALKVNDKYISFFHCCRVLPTVQSDGKAMQHYTMGAYIFENHPPFSITSMSPQIIVGDFFYDPPYHRTWKPLRVVFPCGLIIDKDKIVVSYGRQDHEAWIAIFDKNKLLNSLQPINHKK